MTITTHLRPLSSTTTETRHQRSERTAELFAAAHNEADPCRRDQLLDQIVLANLGVAEAVARRFSGRDVDEEDLRQVAYEALVKAARRFDVDRNKDFLSYAVPTVRGELQRYFRDLGWTVRPTRTVQETQWRISRAEERLAQELGRTPRREEVAHALELSVEEYDAAMGATGCFRPTSLDQPASSDHTGGATVGDLLAVDHDELAAGEARVVLEPVLRLLPARDRRILRLRFYEDRTQQEIGAEIGVTQTQVSRILAQILDSLREELTRLPESGRPGSHPPAA